MDTSTTVQYAAQALEAQNVVVVTNSIDIADILSGKEGVKLHVLGGRVFDRIPDTFMEPRPSAICRSSG